ncbi:MAG TPA: hypothetical protein VE623_22525 [Acidimicrobiales bacterium]|jgi:hypothetical protein|nr:hypothetical protein [Acidimicrobiales bacterium]
MPETDDDLALALRELGERLDLPAPVDPVGAAVGRIVSPDAFSRRKWSPGRPFQVQERVGLAAAALILVALAGVLAVPRSRQAVADWLGIGKVTVTYTGDVPEAAGRTYDFGTPVSSADAVATAERAGWELEAPPTAGDPARAFIGRPTGAVTLVWAPSGELPDIDDTGIGLLLTAIPGTTDAGGVTKRGTSGMTVELVRVGESPAYWIAGEPHEVVVTDAEGDPVHDSSRLAGNTLVWTEGDVTYRLESALDRKEALDLASALRPLH